MTEIEQGDTVSFKNLRTDIKRRKIPSSTVGNDSGKKT